jgi:hypothetical protein
MLLGVAFLMLREFGMSYKFGLLGESYREFGASLPWLSSLVLPAVPCAWWSTLTPLFCAIGVAARVPSGSRTSLAILWLAIASIANAIVLGAFLPYVKGTSTLGYVVSTDPTPLQIAVNAVLLVASGAWMGRGIHLAKRER